MSTHFKISGYFAVLAVIAALIPVHARAGQIGNPITANGFTFINFDPSATSVISNANGISNRGYVVVPAFDANGDPLNFIGTPARTTALSAGVGAMAFGINSARAVVGMEKGAAFYLSPGGTLELLSPAAPAIASGINDKGEIVGQFTTPEEQTPGFLLRSLKSVPVTIYSPFILNIVNAQGINNFELIVGYYVGPDGQAHGFTAEASQEKKGVIMATAVPDPQIPNIPGEPGATLIFSQLLGVNDAGIAVGYYGDSTLSQHGFLYDTNTGTYTFLDNPSAAFSNGVEVTQITGVADSGELSGFYTDANGVAHSFTACPTYAFCPNYPNIAP